MQALVFVLCLLLILLCCY